MSTPSRKAVSLTDKVQGSVQKLKSRLLLYDICKIALVPVVYYFAYKANNGLSTDVSTVDHILNATLFATSIASLIYVSEKSGQKYEQISHNLKHLDKE